MHPANYSLLYSLLIFISWTLKIFDFCYRQIVNSATLCYACGYASIQSATSVIFLTTSCNCNCVHLSIPHAEQICFFASRFFQVLRRGAYSETRIDNCNRTDGFRRENFRIRQKDFSFKSSSVARFANILRGNAHLHLDEIPYFHVQPPSPSLRPSERTSREFLI